MKTVNIIVGMPRDVTNLTGIEYVPYKNSRIVKCENCQSECWCGPEQGKILDAGEGVVICGLCLAGHMRNEMGLSAEEAIETFKRNATILTDKQMGE